MDIIGKGRSYEVVEYRKIIMRELCSNAEIIKLLGESDTEEPEDVIPYKCVYPHEFVPNTIVEVDRYINFEISASIDTRNNVYRDLSIYFFVMCHQRAIRYKDKGREYLWYDKVTCVLDDIFSESDLFGVGKIVLSSNTPYAPADDFKGRLLTFKVKDFNNCLKYGK